MLAVRSRLWSFGMNGFVPNKALHMNDKSVCPTCFSLFPLSFASLVPSTCPDCDSEAMSVDLTPLEDFIASHSLEELRNILAKWSAVTGFRDSYKLAKTKRIEIVIELKSREMA
jgi:hypothetical protein